MAKLGLKHTTIERVLKFLRRQGFTSMPPDSPAKVSSGEFLFPYAANIAAARLAQSGTVRSHKKGLNEELRVLDGMHAPTAEHFREVLDFLIMDHLTPPEQ